MKEQACALHHFIVCVVIRPNTNMTNNFDGFENLHCDWSKHTD